MAEQRTRAFGQVLRELRDQRGLTQEDLGRYVDKDKTTVARLESGDRRPPREISFYEGLHRAGISKEDIARLLQTGQAPTWLVKDQEDEQIKSAPLIRSDDGLVVELRIRPSKSLTSEEDLDDLLTKLVEDVQFRLLQRKKEAERRQMEV